MPLPVSSPRASPRLLRIPDVAELSFRQVEGDFDAPGPVRFHYQGYLPRTARQPTVVAAYLHGFASGTLCDIERQFLVRALVAGGVSVYGFHLRGHGGSGGTQELHPPDVVADDILQFRIMLDTLEPRLPVHMIANGYPSLGVTRFMARTRGLIASCVVMTPPYATRPNNLHPEAYRYPWGERDRIRTPTLILLAGADTLVDNDVVRGDLHHFDHPASRIAIVPEAPHVFATDPRFCLPAAQSVGDWIDERSAAMG